MFIDFDRVCWSNCWHVSGAVVTCKIKSTGSDIMSL